ncbi:MAG: electron transfer flavoprotein subunit alpha/FixB family protein [Anaerolineales bacterium]|nr:electron transfer flavoprotein subunit alpha/FixB family protein [Anaerolineales bacterium]
MAASLYGVEEESKTIWVYLEQESGLLESVSLELLSQGRAMADQLGWKLCGLLVGRGVSGLIPQSFAYGADETWLAEHPLLEHFTIEAYARVVFQALMQGKPSVFLLGATPNGRDLAGRLAVRLRTGLNADCTGLNMTSAGVLVSEVSGFGGGVLALIQMAQHRPQMATVRPGVFAAREPDPARSGKLVELEVHLAQEMIQTRILERVVGKGLDLGRAPVLVAGGRGVEGNFEMLRELADLLGGEVGATRPPVDEGRIERERQVGQTGVVCSPNVAICCGISGAFHFVVGVEKAGTVIAINSDPEAPIFDFADYCIVGDVHQVLPALIAELRKHLPDAAQQEQEAAYA